MKDDRTCVCGDGKLAIDPGPRVSGDRRYLLGPASFAIYKHARILRGPRPTPKATGVREVSVDITERRSCADANDVSLSHEALRFMGGRGGGRRSILLNDVLLFHVVVGTYVGHVVYVFM